MIMIAKNLSISDPVDTLTEGMKICKISNGKSATMFASVDEVDTPFEPSSFDKNNISSKQNLDINCTKEYLDFFTQFDKWAVEYITLNSLRLLGEERPIEKVRDIYKTCIKRDNYEPKLRTKITLEGSGKTRYWSMDKRPRLAPDSWRSTVFKTQIRIAYMYVTEANIGFTLDCMDIQICKELSETTCPF
jgi:hypothetical protein